MDTRTPLIGMTLEQLQQVAAQCAMPRFAAKQMCRWLYEKRVTEIEQMTDLSKQARQRLAESYTIGLEKPLAQATSADGTIKFLFRGCGGRSVETVYIPDNDRATLCVSSQAGCRMGCTFCMTGRQGYHGNLSAHQIINQVLAIPQSRSLTNIVFMGMGEPLDNLDEVLQAIQVLTAPWGLAWSPKRITVSSIGKMPQLQTLLEATKAHVAISLHNPVAAQRAELMPSEKAFPIKQVLELLRNYDFSHQRRLSFEYIMWRGINDSPRYAQSLARLLNGLDCRVNLIRYHSSGVSDNEPACSDPATMESFRDRLNQLGITATIRTSRGEDIQAACGMLAGEHDNK
ncbi:MAG: 23S rRNA (adenine(2503)-C(2))-methyltransferase RlmN [Muribaculum sp.]|nr:23S rRNA (adenine(2503)-C(2))-methyltransferase RlmN [Muribaculaceae bacterium]MCM1081251.1 23S rRNA (adenine(2503)-C(2))-methyltransferase RlmN [Muribaculum sp.]